MGVATVCGFKEIYRSPLVSALFCSSYILSANTIWCLNFDSLKFFLQKVFCEYF